MNNYFSNKQVNAQKAIAHYNEMNANYAKEIDEAIKSSIIYDDNTQFNVHSTDQFVKSKSILAKTDTVSAIFKFANKDANIACLNFASYKNPGGKFFEGSSAQEESLCHESTLCNVLENFNDSYYAYNKRHVNRSLYLNRAIYSPDILFIHNNKITKCNVITCASPNLNPHYKNHQQSLIMEDNSIALKSRIQFIKNIAETNSINTLILGAYGCGVFKQDPYEVALVFKDTFNATSISTIVYAITPGRNYDAFRTVLHGYCEMI